MKFLDDLFNFMKVSIDQLDVLGVFCLFPSGFSLIQGCIPYNYTQSHTHMNMLDRVSEMHAQSLAHKSSMEQ